MSMLFIDDGYTRRAYIAARPGVHGALEIVYRPMLAEERDTLYAAVERKQPREQVRMIAIAIAERVESWSAADVAVSADNVRRLQPALFNRVYNLINGSLGSDAYPDGSMPDEDEDNRDALAGAADGQTTGLAREARLEKN